MKGPWLQIVEAMLVKRLLESPTFHEGVHKVARGVHRIRHGTPPEELGGTKIDRPGGGFIQHFLDEVRTQIGTSKGGQGQNTLQSPQKVAGRNKAQQGRDPNQPEPMSNFYEELRRRAQGNK